MNQERPEEYARWLNLHRCPRTLAMQQLVAVITNEALDLEHALKLRKRARKPADRVIFDRLITGIVCSMAHAVLLEGPEVRRAVRLGRMTESARYRPVNSGQLRPLLDLMSHPALGNLISRQIGRRAWDDRPGVATIVAAGPRLAALVESNGLTLDDIGERSGREVIILRSTREQANRGNQDGGSADLSAYEDTPETIAMRADVTAINERLQMANLQVDESERAEDGPVDTTQRVLYRVFNDGTWDRGGRLYGGFWQQLSGAERCNAVTIDGEPVAEFDYGSMQPRLALTLSGVVTDPGIDLYHVPGYERHREDFKGLLVAALASYSPLARYPQGVAMSLRGVLKAPDALALLTGQYPGLEPWLGHGRGLELMRTESDIAVRVILEANRKGFVVLPIHDSFLVPRSRTEETRTLMIEAFQAVTGTKVEPKVNLKAPPALASASSSHAVARAPASPVGNTCSSPP